MGRDRIIDDQQQIVKEAFAIIDAEGSDAFSIRKLAHRLGTSHMTIYNYFNRDELFGEVVKHGFRIILDRLQPIVEEHMQRGESPYCIFMLIAEQMMSFADEHSYAYRFMFQSASSPATRDPSVSRMYFSGVELLRSRIGEEEFQRIEDDAYLFLVMVNGLIIAYLDHRHGTTEEKCRQHIRRGFQLIFGRHCTAE